MHQIPNALSVETHFDSVEVWKDLRGWRDVVTLGLKGVEWLGPVHSTPYYTFRISAGSIGFKGYQEKTNQTTTIQFKSLEKALVVVR